MFFYFIFLKLLDIFLNTEIRWETQKKAKTILGDIQRIWYVFQSINKSKKIYIYLYVNIPTMQHNTRSNALLIAFKFSKWHYFVWNFC